MQQQWIFGKECEVTMDTDGIGLVRASQPSASFFPSFSLIPPRALLNIHARNMIEINGCDKAQYYNHLEVVYIWALQSREIVDRVT
jgi:hypothetical protein